jgi:hypothetical protein
MPLINFPNVPNVAGVPALLRNVSNIGTAVAGAIAAVKSIGSLSNFLAPKWGVFNASDNSPMLDADSFVGIDYRNDSRVSDYPVEQGSFASYNKVATPIEIRVRLSKGGSESDRTAFLVALKKAQASTNLYNVIVPEGAYRGFTLVSYDFRRESHNGAGLIIADLAMREVRQVAVASFSSSNGAAPISASQTSSVGAASPFSVGQVQASVPTTTQAALFGPNTVS